MLVQFNDNVILFDFAGYTLIGNLQTGYTIGLTQDGTHICKRLKMEPVPHEEIEAVDKNLFEHLGKGKFFDSCPEDMGVKSAYVHVTQFCNLDCVGCYSYSENRNTIQDPEVSTLKRGLDKLTEAGVSSLVISGGEPFLRKDLHEILQHAYVGCGIEDISIITNGTLIKEPMLDRLAPFTKKIAVSIDGYSDDCIPYIRREQRFSQLVRSIELIKKAGIKAHIIPTIHSKNIPDIPHYIQLAKDMGITMNFSLFSCENRSSAISELLFTDEDLSYLAEISFNSSNGQTIEFQDTPISLSLSSKCSCGTAVRNISIDSDGSVYPCHMLHNSELSLGNIFNEDVKSILYSKQRQRFQSFSIENAAECSTCDIKYLCGGGCRARAFFTSGSLGAKDSYCTFMQDFYAKLDKRLREALYS